MLDADQSQDEEGLIDLRALVSIPPPPSVTSVAPLFNSEPPQSAFSLDAGRRGSSVAPGRASHPNTVATLAGLVALVVLAGAGIAFAFRGATPVDMAALAPPPPRAPAAAALMAPAPPIVEPTPMADESDDASSEPSATSVTSTEKAKRTAKPRGAGAVTGAKAKPKSPDAAVKPTVSKAADPCGCRGNLDCNIRCSAGK